MNEWRRPVAAPNLTASRLAGPDPQFHCRHPHTHPNSSSLETVTKDEGEGARCLGTHLSGVCQAGAWRGWKEGGEGRKSGDGRGGWGPQGRRLCSPVAPFPSSPLLPLLPKHLCGP